MADNDSAVADNLEPEIYTGWRSAANHVVLHPFNAVAVVTNGDDGEFFYFWTHDQKAAEEYININSSHFKKMCEEEGGPWATVLGVLELADDGLKCHTVKTIGFDSADGAKVRKEAKKNPELVFFDVPSDKHENILRALKKDRGEVEEIKPRQRKKVDKNNAEQTSGDAVTTADQNTAVPELESTIVAANKATTKKAKVEGIIKKADDEIHRILFLEAKGLGLRPNTNWKTETLRKKVAEAKSAKKSIAASKASKTAKLQDETEEDNGDDLATKLEESLRVAEDAKKARDRRRQSAKARVNGDQKKIAKQPRNKVKADTK